MTQASFIIAACAVLVAGGIQRVTGMGFALCATPVLVAIYGAAEGVRLVVLLGAAASLFLLVRLWPDVDWRVAWKLTWPGIAVSPLAALAIWWSPEPALLLVVGAAALLSLFAASFPQVAMVVVGRGAELKTGVVAGLLNLSSGLSGPPLLGYAENARMPQLTFIATVQVVFVALDAVTMLWRGLPTIPVADSLLLVAAAAAGIAVASAVARFAAPRFVRMLMFVIAWIGTVVVLAKGVLALL